MPYFIMTVLESYTTLLFYLLQLEGRKYNTALKKKKIIIKLFKLPVQQSAVECQGLCKRINSNPPILLVVITE